MEYSTHRGDDNLPSSSKQEQYLRDNEALIARMRILRTAEQRRRMLYIETQRQLAKIAAKYQPDVPTDSPTSDGKL
jgi:hypothetical protein